VVLPLNPGGFRLPDELVGRAQVRNGQVTKAGCGAAAPKQTQVRIKIVELTGRELKIKASILCQGFHTKQVAAAGHRGTISTGANLLRHKAFRSRFMQHHRISATRSIALHQVTVRMLRQVWRQGIRHPTPPNARIGEFPGSGSQDPQPIMRHQNIIVEKRDPLRSFPEGRVQQPIASGRRYR